LVKQSIIFRADGNHTIGLGHISRCIALAELLRPSHKVTFAVQNPDEGLVDVLKKIADEIIPLPTVDPASADFRQELDPYLKGDEIIVLDGYSFTAEYEKGLKANSRAVVTIDDIPSRHFYADVIFNFCGSIDPRQYAKEYYTQIFLGLPYVFLRSPFLQRPPAKQLNNRLLLNMGGTDPRGATRKVIEQLIGLPFRGEIEIVIGNTFRDAEGLRRLISPHPHITLHQGLNAYDMYEVMSRCSIAILPPSTVALEFLSTGGFVFLYQTADNQQLLKKYLLDLKLAQDYEETRSLNVESQLWQEILSRQKIIFDGLSSNRVLAVFSNLTRGSQLTLSRATVNDIALCFEWANDPETRQNSYSTGMITWEHHVAWFEKKLVDPGSYYFIASLGGNKVGQIRFDQTRDAGTYQISYLLDKAVRGKGLSHFLLTKGVGLLQVLDKPRKIVGFVQKKNVSSIKAFQRAGYESSVSTEYIDSFKFELSLN
jgi:UDP-2,4-diacetamido-2,4,6-trideoxy-beta-L-altropyranose hydrolase